VTLERQTSSTSTCATNLPVLFLTPQPNKNQAATASFAVVEGNSEKIRFGMETCDGANKLY